MTRQAVRIGLALLLASLSAVAMPDRREWNFEVRLGEREIGWHRFTLDVDGDAALLKSEAEFEVRLLGFRAYHYRHLAFETWQDGALTEIRSATDDNGRDHRVDGRRVDAGFRLSANGEQRRLPEAPLSFAYWNPAILEADRLLNSQTGEWVDVEVRSLGEESYAGQPDGAAPARRYRLEGDRLRIDLWYSAEGDWLALESPAPRGATLSYRRR